MNEAARRKRIMEVTSMVGYRKDLSIRPSRLSMGEQKLIAFARAMLCQPNLLYLDEWTESLDEIAAKRLVSLVKKKHSEGTSIIFVSHVMSLLKEMADAVFVIANGKVSLRVTGEQLSSDPNIITQLEKEITS
jgi:ABC-type multidrug transport system ATPase subunit